MVFRLHYAREIDRVERRGDALVAVAPTKNITKRGDVLNQPLLTDFIDSTLPANVHAEDLRELVQSRASVRTSASASSIPVFGENSADLAATCGSRARMNV